MYGAELILDLHNCRSLPVDRKIITEYCDQLCELIEMERAQLHFWDYEGYPADYNKAPAHLKGISAVQFIKTSSVVIHTLDDLHKVFVNIFSCKDFDRKKATTFTAKFFKGKVASDTLVSRV
jgi:S-adenosylmethionine/arginine decarboxylase-like enzyme